MFTAVITYRGTRQPQSATEADAAAYLRFARISGYRMEVTRAGGITVVADRHNSVTFTPVGPADVAGDDAPPTLADRLAGLAREHRSSNSRQRQDAANSLADELREERKAVPA